VITVLILCVPVGPAGVRAAVSRPLLAADGAATLLLWLVLTGAVVLLALTATWFLGSMAIDGLLTMATRCAWCQALL
jgi:hypothetical protein